MFYYKAWDYEDDQCDSEFDDLQWDSGLWGNSHPLG